eukprot:2859325-Rhodomonas_salina.3
MESLAPIIGPLLPRLLLMDQVGTINTQASRQQERLKSMQVDTASRADTARVPSIMHRETHRPRQTAAKAALSGVSQTHAELPPMAMSVCVSGSKAFESA